MNADNELLFLDLHEKTKLWARGAPVFFKEYPLELERGYVTVYHRKCSICGTSIIRHIHTAHVSCIGCKENYKRLTARKRKSMLQIRSMG